MVDDLSARLDAKLAGLTELIPILARKWSKIEMGWERQATKPGTSAREAAMEPTRAREAPHRCRAARRRHPACCPSASPSSTPTTRSREQDTKKDDADGLPGGRQTTGLDCPASGRRPAVLCRRPRLVAWRPAPVVPSPGASARRGRPWCSSFRVSCSVCEWERERGKGQGAAWRRGEGAGWEIWYPTSSNRGHRIWLRCLISPWF